MSHLSVQTKLETVSSNLHYYVQKTSTTSKFLNKGSTVIFLFIFISTTYIIKFSICLYSEFFFLSFKSVFCFTNTDYLLIRTTPHYSGLARVYCIRFNS
jgi:hypothetical protein